MKNLKEELKYGKKGITLISLVVTIIVLLILAGITITTLTGENGILTRATEAKKETEKAQKTEQETLNDIQEYLGIGPKEVANNPEKYYGAYVDYAATYRSTDIEAKSDAIGSVGWQIFYADQNNIYLIADDYINTIYLEKSNNILLNGYKVHADSQNRKLLLDYLNTEKNWNKLKTSKAINVKGAPTLEQFINSYNAKHDTKLFYKINTQMEDGINGYYVGTTEDPDSYNIPNINENSENLYFKKSDKATRYWLASGSARVYTHVMAISKDEIGYTDCTDGTIGVRPIVCLSSEIELIKENDYFRIK